MESADVPSTMTLSELLQALHKVGARLSVHDGRLRIDAPKGAVTPDLQSAIRMRKEELLDLVGNGPSTTSVPLVASAAGEPVPLSHAQEGVWLVQALDPTGTAYNLVPVVRLQGPVQSDRLRRALETVVQRHQALRTCIARSSVHAEQRVCPVPQDLLRIEDLSALPADARADAANAIVRREQGRPFDLESETPFRAVLIRRSPERSDLVMAFHHIAVDGASLLVFFRDLLDTYDGRELPELPATYADYARWARKVWGGADFEKELHFWTEYLEGAPTLLDLPTDHPRPAVQTFNGGLLQRDLDANTTARVLQVARGQGASLFMVLTAALAAALHRSSGQRDLLLGTPVDGRPRAELKDLVGMFVNQVPLRIRVPRGVSFNGLLESVRGSALQSFAHQELPFSLLVEGMKLPRDRSRTPLFQAMVNVQPPVAGTSREAAGVVFSAPGDDEVRSLFDGQAKFDLTLYGREHAGQIHLSLVYNRDLFCSERMETLLGHVEQLLVHGPKAPGLPIDRCFPVPATASPWAWDEPPQPGETVVQRFLAAATKGGDSPAIVDDDGVISWQALRCDAERIARLVASEAPEAVASPVGVFVEHRSSAASAIMGVLLSGRPYVPLDSGYPEARLRFMVEDAGASMVLIDPDLAEGAASVFGDGVRIVAMTATPPEGPLPIAPSPDDLAYLLYTSGSTGTPKAVLQTHRNLVRQADRYGRVLGLGPADRVALTASISFDASLMDLFGSLLSGAAVSFVDLREVDLARLPELIDARGLTVMHVTPTVFRTLARSVHEPCFSTVRAVDLGGEAVRAEDVAFFDSIFPPSAVLVNSYGPSEHTLALCNLVQRDLHQKTSEVPIGWPIGDVEVLLLGEDGEPDPVRGEMVLRSAFGALGYWNRPELTDRAFPVDADQPDRRMYRTGDVALRRADGAYVFLHRVDGQLKIRGHRVEPGEVEAVLTAHPEVVEAVVVSHPAADGVPILAAFVVAAESATLASSDLAEWCRERLPSYLVPSALSILSALPRTPTGKIDRGALPTGADPGKKRSGLAPRNAEESVLREVWAEVLGRAEDDVAVTDDLFELGGHSLGATQIAARVRAVFDVEMPLRRLFDHPTIAETAAWVRENRSTRSSLPPVEPHDSNGGAPLSFSQERMWFLQALSPTDTAYNMAHAARVRGPFDPERFLDAVAVVTSRHDILRTRIRTERGRPMQVVGADVGAEVYRVDLRSHPESERMSRAVEQITEVVTRPYDLAEDSVMRIAIATFSEEDHVLAVGLHHTAADQWSFGIFTREVAVAYERHADEGVLPPLSVQYRDYAIWQRRWLEGQALQEQLAYWKERLAGVEPLDLPTDRPRPQFFGFKGDIVGAGISPSLEDGLRRMALTLRVTPFMVLLAGFKCLLHAHARQDDVTVGVPIANRTHHELEGLIGTFVNTLVHRNDLSGDPTFRQLVEQIRATALGAYAHQDLPIELLVKELNPPRDTSRAPIFQVLFNLANTPTQVRWLEGVEVEPLLLRRGVAQFDLTVNVLLHEQGSGIQLTYNSELFTEDTARRLVDHYVEILERAVEDSDRSLSRICSVGSAEREVLLERWNATSAEYARSSSVPELVATQAEGTPDRIAVESPTGSYTYGQLVEEAQRVTAALGAMGVVPGDRVAILMERSREMVAALLGILGAGAAYVPVDPAYPASRVRYMVEHSQAAALLTHRGLQERFGLVTPVLDMDRWAAPAAIPFRAVDPEQTAYVIYTSGSTGQPKGVEIPHRAMVNFLTTMSREPGLAADDVLLAVTTISFDIAVLELYLPLIVGARVVVSGEEDLADGHKLVERLQSANVTVMQATPSTWKLLVAAGWMGNQRMRALCGGEALPPSLAADVLERVGELWNMYGPTETTVWSTVQRVSPNEPVLIGRPIANTTAYVLDESREPVPVGVPGELWIGGAGVAKGYVGRPDLTAERFIDDPFRAGERMYRTGDLVRYRSDGRLEHLGRLDHQVKVRGFRIELGEVEAVLRSHAGVQDAVVVARDERLLAYLVYELDAPTVGELRTLVAATLPAYMMPSFFVAIDTFPLTPNGKVDRKQLPDPSHAAPDPVEFEPPTLPSQQVIAEVWSELLSVEHVGLADNFFELGGHSLLAMEVVALVEERTGHRLDPRSLFFKTLAQLAESLPMSV